MGICLSTAGIQLYTLQMLGALCVPTSWEQCCWWSQFSRPSSISGGQTLGLTSSLPKNFLEAEMCAANLMRMVALVFAAGWLWESDQCSYFPLWDLVSNVLFRMAKRMRLLRASIYSDLAEPHQHTSRLYKIHSHSLFCGRELGTNTPYSTSWYDNNNPLHPYR